MLELPEINCTATLTGISFSWEMPQQVDQVTFNIFTGQVPITMSDSNLVFEGLAPEEDIEIGFTFFSSNACPNQNTILTCQTIPCPDINLDITPVDPICLSPTTGLVPLEVEVIGGTGFDGSGTWSGPGITDASEGIFSPLLAGVGVHMVQYEYQIATCIYQESIAIVVNSIPTASFEAPTAICITENATISYSGNATNAATYQWGFGLDATSSGTGAGPYSVSWNTPGMKIIALQVEANGCLSEPFSLELEVQPELESPNIDCVPSLTTIDISWGVIPGASGYIVSWLGNTATVTEPSFSLPNLEPNQEVTIEVTALSTNECPNSSTLISCSTLPCPEVELAILPIDPICYGGRNDTLALEFNTSGISDLLDLAWQGPNFISTTPPLVMLDEDWVNRENQFILSYQIASCFYSDTILIEVSPEPIASFQIPAVSCLADTNIVTFTGLTGANPVVNWDFDGGQAQPGVGLDPHLVSWETVGLKTVTLDITENGCTAPTASETILVEPPLEVPTISCSATYDSIELTWNSVELAESYSVLVLPVFENIRTSDTSLLVTNIPENTSINFNLNVISPNSCNDLDIPLTCSTLACPEVNINLSGPSAICLGDIATITVQIDNANTGPFDIQVFDGTTTLNWNGVQDGDQFQLSLIGTTQLSVTSITNLSATVCAPSLPNAIQIQVNQPVSAGTALAPFAICNNLNRTIQLSDQLFGEMPNGSWMETTSIPSTGFNPGSGQFQTENQLPGTYTFQYLVEAEAPCPNSFSEVEVSILETPVADAGPDQGLTCDDPETDIGINIDISDPNLEYNWTSVEGHFIEDPSQTSLLVNMPGDYILALTNTENGCMDQDTVRINSDISFITPYVSVSNISCFQAQDGFISIDSIQGGSAPLSYFLNGEDIGNRNLFTSLEPGIYELLVQDSKGCETLLTLEIEDKSETTVELINNIEGIGNLIQLGDGVLLEALTNIPSEALDTVIWTPDSLSTKNELEQFIQPFATATYSVTVQDTTGCMASDQMTIFVERQQDVYIPNAFSPDGDGQNDIFFIFAGQEVREIKKLAVFNRWGEALVELTNFQPNDPRFGWDGTYRGQLLNPGIFVYFAEIEMIDGEVVLFKGDVALIR